MKNLVGLGIRSEGWVDKSKIDTREAEKKDPKGKPRFHFIFIPFCPLKLMFLHNCLLEKIKKMA